MDGDGAARVIDVGDVVEEPDAAAHEEAGDQSDQACCPRRHERAGCGDRDEAGEHAVAGHRDVRFAVDPAGERHRGNRAEYRRRHGIDDHHRDAQVG